MGVILAAGFAVGLLAGLVVSALLGAAAAVLVVRNAKVRAGAARTFWIAWPAGTVALLLIAHLWPYEEARPGSDYDVAARSLFLRGFGYAASIGGSAAVAALLTCGCRRKR